MKLKIEIFSTFIILQSALPKNLRIDSFVQQSAGNHYSAVPLPGLFPGRGVFLELGHFDINQNTRTKGRTGKYLGLFLQETLKNAF